MNTARFRSAGRTDTGKVRAINQDAILVREDLGLWVVADGMGGHAAGEFASGLIVERLGTLSRPPDVCDFLDRIDDALVQVNTDVRREAIARGVDIIGSTVVTLVYDAAFMLCSWVGDSRVYGFEDGRLWQMTRDHVHGADDDVTRFGPSAGAPAPGSAALTRAVGAEDALCIDWTVAGARAGMQFLLCSDGINKEICDDELAAECRAGHADPHAFVDVLVDRALDRGARDNVSAVIVQIEG